MSVAINHRARLLAVCILVVAFGCGVYLFFKFSRSAPPAAPTAPPSGEVVNLAGSSAIDKSKVQSLLGFSQQIQQLIAAVVPAVVSIETEGYLASQSSLNQGSVLIRGVGSGVIVSKQGHVITNWHVVKDKQKIRITTHDGKTFMADKIGEDRFCDLALLKIQAQGSGFQALKFADSQHSQVGQLVFALGNPFGLGESVSQGIISAKQRSVGDIAVEMFQTDAALNPGNSGGPLVNIYGEIIGINTAVTARNSSLDNKESNSQGLGFAIPSSTVKESLLAMLQGSLPPRGYLGVGLLDVTPRLSRAIQYQASSGAIINEIKEGSPADQIGLRVGDVILTWNGREIKNSRELVQLITKTKPNTTIPVTYWQQGIYGANIITRDVTVMHSGEWIDEKVYHPNRRLLAAMGLTVRNMSFEELLANPRGIVVENAQVVDGVMLTPLRSGDIIYRINGNSVNNINQLYDALDSEERVLVGFRRANGYYQYALVITQQLRAKLLNSRLPAPTAEPGMMEARGSDEADTQDSIRRP